MPSFALYLMAIFCSPLYFLRRKKWGAFTFNLILYLSAIPLLFVFFLGVFPWMLGVAHALWYLRDELMRHHAQVLAEQIRGNPTG